MNILFVTGGPALPQMVGGSQRTADAVIQGLIARGHRVSMLASLIGGGYVGWRSRVQMKLLGRRGATDRLLGYPVHRAWFPEQAVAEAVARSRADVVVVLAHGAIRMAHAVSRTGLPFLFAFQDVELASSASGLADLLPVHGIANSRFTADHYRRRFGIDPVVIHPIIHRDRYKTETSREFVTFVNPDPCKGVDLAIDVARACPELPFLFVEAWPLTTTQRNALKARLSELPNVTLHAPVQDMRRIYARTRILLAPSQWEEAYGRVATEAQVSGIPVIGSNRGGLPEAIGDGGLVIDWQAPAPIWAAALSALWTDGGRYAALSARASGYAARPALNVEMQFDQWARAIEATVAETWDALPRAIA